ncbi:MAG: glycosyltransferase [Proteobacteria bacterium]|nr:glycosyltransferase [Pseudomonadota bacterium]MBU4296463.1 glycosyltransferase [Pseudomonadota bacterium]MCG2749234.1 glycosyltransferase [Desulfobulbaceae bacterium]
MPIKISVIIPTWNRQEFLARAIDSVLGQSYTDFELIVVDDGSTDDTARRLAGYGAQVRSIHQENRGPAAARNTGIRAAEGAFVAFLDSDDRFAPEKLAVQQAAMAAHPEYLISHTDEIWYRRGEQLNQKKKHFRPHGHIFAECLKLCVVGMSTVMVRREFFAKVGYFDEELPCCEDYDLWLRASVSLPFLKVDRPLTIKAGGRPDQVSARFRAGMDKFRIRAMVKVLGQQGLSDEQRNLARQELARKCRIFGNGCVKHGRPEEGRYYMELAADVLR